MKLLINNEKIISFSPRLKGDDEEAFLTEWASENLNSDDTYEIVEDEFVSQAGNATLADVKAEAGRRILEKLPAWKQSNLIAREAELIATEGGHLRDSNGVKLPARDLTNDEVGELVHIKTLWDWVKSVRAASGAIEQSPPPIDQLKTDNRWPA